MNTKIFSVFPACGKTYMYENQDDFDLKILDSDSSNFSWTTRKRTEEELEAAKKEWDSVPHLLSGDMYINKIRDEEIKVRHPDFPNNYIEHIKENIGKVDYIFVSSHAEVRRALDNANIDYTIVYPDEDCLAEWVGRCYLRQLKGNNGFPIEVLVNNWDNWIDGCKVCGMKHKEIILKHGEYLSNIFQ